MQPTAYETNVSVKTSLRPRIFVSIASYRDSECQHTVIDLFNKAKHPERIFVGICWQFDPLLDEDCFEHAPPYPDQVRSVNYHISETKGCCWARCEALKLRQGEEYVLQLDAHMRFVQDWDEVMIETLARCPGNKNALSTMPPAYLPPEELQDCTDGIPITYISKLWAHDGFQPVSLGGWIRNRNNVEPGPILNAIYTGNFLFASARMFDEVPFDPHVFFRGEEPLYSLRLWTHGWDLYQPDKVVIYHYWQSPGRDDGGAAYKKNLDINATNAPEIGRQRVMHVMGLGEAKDPAALVEIEKYGAGTERSTQDFWTFLDVDMEKKIIGEKAAKGRWTPYKS